MSKRHPLWAIERPDGTIIEESVGFQSKHSDSCWVFAVEFDKKWEKIVEDAFPSDLDNSYWLKKAGYKLVKASIFLSLMVIPVIQTQSDPS